MLLTPHRLECFGAVDNLAGLQILKPGPDLATELFGPRCAFSGSAPKFVLASATGTHFFIIWMLPYRPEVEHFNQNGRSGHKRRIGLVCCCHAPSRMTVL